MNKKKFIMKPEEFDEQVRRKFDRGDFSYDPGQWSRLEERLDGETKKRRVAIWWMPLLGIAAALSMSLGYASYMKRANEAVPAPLPTALKMETHRAHATVADTAVGVNAATMPRAMATKQPPAAPTDMDDAPTGPKIDRTVLINGENPLKPLQKTMLFETALPNTRLDLLQNDKERERAKKKAPAAVAQKSAPAVLPVPNATGLKSSVLLAAGIGHGAGTSSYTFGATGRRMLNNRVFVEGDLAFTTGSNTQKTATAATNSQEYASGKMGATARTSAGAVNTEAPPATNVIVADKSYNVSYAQITPSIGYKIHRKLSVAVGPDFQQALQDNRPAPATMDKHNVEVDPLFDLGLVGKTELTVSGNLKAALIYRSGINNIVTPMDKYIDRNYFQFQVRYVIFNKSK